MPRGGWRWLMTPRRTWRRRPSCDGDDKTSAAMRRPAHLHLPDLLDLPRLLDYDPPAPRERFATTVTQAWYDLLAAIAGAQVGVA